MFIRGIKSLFFVKNKKLNVIFYGRVAKFFGTTIFVTIRKRQLLRIDMAYLVAGEA